MTTPVATDRRGLLSVADAATYLGGVHPETVRRWITNGDLPSVRLGRRVMLAVADLDALIARARR